MKEVQGEFPLGEGTDGPQPIRPAPEGPFASVAVTVPIAHHLTYTIPASMRNTIAPGLRVLVPIGSRKVTGFVVAIEESISGVEGDIKPISSLLEERPCLVPNTLTLGLWVARYYGAGPGEALEALVPAAVRHGRKGKEDVLVELTDRDLAQTLLEEHLELPSWESRVRVLRTLLASPEPLRLRDLLVETRTTPSPVETLRRARIVRKRRVASQDDPFAGLSPKPTRPPPLTEDQDAVLRALLPRVDATAYQAVLLHGVTGSGKTEVYLQLLERTLSLGRTAILLVPEISLTPQTVERILGRIPSVAVLHSHLSEGDRSEQWRRLRDGEARVAVGPRSALFAPLQNVGLIILDEEHETTFKQQQNPRYHARDVALERGRIERALVVLGTATPSLETEARVADRSMIRLRLPRRVGNRPMPTVGIVDMRHEKPVGPGGMFSRVLVNSMDETLNRGGQVMLFLNRRGYSTNVLCKVCGWVAACNQCAIHLTHYQGIERLICHHCGRERAAPKVCPECNNPQIRYAGFGTEKVAAAVKRLFPERHVGRMDGETLRRRGAPEQIFRDLTSGKIDILVGTQALAKGLDIPNVTLVGVVSADTALLIPDFRSSERTFQLLCQVAGRAGRGDQPGHVIIQTYTPDHPAIVAARHHDHERFAAAELLQRSEVGYPPKGHLVRVVSESAKVEVGRDALKALRTEADGWPETRPDRCLILGPAPCPLELLKGQHRHHMLFIFKSAEAATAVLPKLPRRSGKRLKILIDRDPVAVL